MLRADALVDGMLASSGTFDNTGLDIRVYAAASADKSKLVYGQVSPASANRQRAGWFESLPDTFTRNVDVAGTAWQMVISARPAPIFAHHASALFALLAGLLTTCAASTYLQAVSRRSQHIQQLVAQRTEELKQVNRVLLDDIKARTQAEEALRQSRSALRQLADHQERLKEDERKRIARDIHDDLGQNLLVLRIDVSMLVQPPASPGIYREKVDAVLNQIDTTIKSVRSIINDLRPGVLDLGLHAAIEWQAKEFERRSGIACELHIDHQEFPLDDKRATAMFRIVQESLSNILRHAQANNVRIDVQLAQGRLSVKIADDGVGLAPDFAKKANAFGLAGIEERIYALGGTFGTESNAGQGMTVFVSIAL